MDNLRRPGVGTERKIFDPRDASTASARGGIGRPERGEARRAVVDVSRGPSEWIRSNRHLQRITSAGSTAICNWLECYSGRRRENLCQSRGVDLARRGTATVDGTALRTSRDGTHVGASGSNVSTTLVRRRIYGDRTPLAFSNGTGRNGWISLNQSSRPRKTGSAAAFTSRTSFITMANGRCGTSLDQTSRIILCRGMWIAKTAALDGEITRFLRRRR